MNINEVDLITITVDLDCILLQAGGGGGRQMHQGTGHMDGYPLPQEMSGRVSHIHPLLYLRPGDPLLLMTLYPRATSGGDH